MQDHPMFDQMNLIIIQFFVKQIALGLEFLNSSFLVHCDIKPENILLNYNFSIKISDFSLLKQIKTDEKFNLTHGTYCFESPEYFTKNKEVDGKYAEKIDIFALGIIIYYMLYKKYEITKSDKDNNKLNSDFVEGKIKKQIDKIENDKNNGKLNKDLADLVISMINPDISKRASLKDILTNEWINSNENEINRIHSINDGEISKLFIEFQKYQKETFNPKKRRKIQI
jgi:serine/threonine protein kinase